MPISFKNSSSNSSISGKKIINLSNIYWLYYRFYQLKLQLKFIKSLLCEMLKKYHSPIYTLKHTQMKCKIWQQNMVAIGSVVFLLLFTSIFLIFFKTNFWKDKMYKWSPIYCKAFISNNMVAVYIHMKAYQYPISVFLFVSFVHVEVWPLISLIHSGGSWWNLQKSSFDFVDCMCSLISEIHS